MRLIPQQVDRDCAKSPMQTQREQVVRMSLPNRPGNNRDPIQWLASLANGKCPDLQMTSLAFRLPTAKKSFDFAAGSVASFPGMPRSSWLALSLSLSLWHCAVQFQKTFENKTTIDK